LSLVTGIAARTAVRRIGERRLATVIEQPIAVAELAFALQVTFAAAASERSARLDCPFGEFARMAARATIVGVDV